MRSYRQHKTPWAEGTVLPADVTAEVGRDLPSMDRVFSNDAGHFVRLRMASLPNSQVGIDRYLITAAICDAQGRAAVLAGDGARLVEPGGHHVYLVEQDPTDDRTKAEKLEEHWLDYALISLREAASLADPLPPNVASTEQMIDAALRSAFGLPAFG